MRTRAKVDLLTAAHLLQDKHLVWSDDFEAIRKPLAALLQEAATRESRNAHIQEIADRLLEEEFDITV